MKGDLSLLWRMHWINAAEGVQKLSPPLLAGCIPHLPRLKVFVTARPEPHIQVALDECRDYAKFHMQDIEQSVVEGDIQLYLTCRLSGKEVVVKKAVHHSIDCLIFHLGS